MFGRGENGAKIISSPEPRWGGGDAKRFALKGQREMVFARMVVLGACQT